MHPEIKRRGFCKRCGTLLSPSGDCPGINCPTNREEKEIKKD